MNHTVDLSIIDNFEVKHEFFSSAGNGNSKQLSIVTKRESGTTRVLYEVMDHGKIVYLGPDSREAVVRYNIALPIKKAMKTKPWEKYGLTEYEDRILGSFMNASPDLSLTEES